MKQGELFKDLGSRLSESEKTAGVGVPPEDKFEVRFTVDKAIFIALAGLILLIVVFTYGVEHGKKLERELFQSQRDIESITNLARVAAVKKSVSQRQREGSSKLLDKELSAIESEPTAAPVPVPEPKPVVKPLKPKSSFLQLLFPKRSKAPAAGTVETLTTAQPSAPAVTGITEPSTQLQTSPTPEAQPAVPAAAAPEPPVEVKALTKGYEVRILSVSDKKYADLEIARLAKKGIQASTRKSGNYYLVALGPYTLYPEAESALSKAKGAGGFKDAYIRKLS